MKSLILSLAVMSTFIACGNSNKVNSGSPTATNAAAITVVNFEGNYDRIHSPMEMNTMTNNDECGGSIRIVAECAGYKLLSNNRMGAEEFCNVNGGDSDRNPPNPDRNPPNPDRAVVTLQGNQLKSVLALGPSRIFTNTLTLKNDGTLLKESNLKSRVSRCMYQKR